MVVPYLKNRLRSAVDRLMSVRVDGSSARVSVPALYPSGSSAAVEIVLNGDQVFVSDIALGQSEAEMFGAGAFYDFHARKSAESFGVGYDGLSIFALWVSIDRIEGAIIAVANASVTAARNSIHKSIEEKEKKKNDELFERVARVFGIADVSKYEDVAGRDAVWPAHNVVTLANNRKAIFEYVSENQNSIASRFMMFSDLVKSPNNYSLNAVVRNINRIGAKGGMLADVSHVMQIEANDDEYRRRAA